MGKEFCREMTTAFVDLTQIARDVEIVLRAGDAQHKDAKARLQVAYLPRLPMFPGASGMSVLFRTGASVDDLAREGRFPHQKLSVATVGALFDALRAKSYELRLFITPTRQLPDHHTLAVALNGQSLPKLPADAAEALLSALRVVDNAYRGTP